jgi:hypothetical protein
MPGVNNSLDENGRINDPEIVERLKQQVEGLVTFVERLRQTKLRP